MPANQKALKSVLNCCSRLVPYCRKNVLKDISSSRSVPSRISQILFVRFSATTPADDRSWLNQKSTLVASS